MPLREAKGALSVVFVSLQKSQCFCAICVAAPAEQAEHEHTSVVCSASTEQTREVEYDSGPRGAERTDGS